jgi:FkbM family methyltransferase
MGDKNKFKAVIERFSNTRIYHNFLPTGVDLYYDFKKSFKGEVFSTIFDVGANIGQSAEKMIENYPLATIHCFEPVTSTYNILRNRFKNTPNINCHKIALGSESKSSKIVVAGLTNDCSYVTDHVSEDQVIETIEIITLDQFCEEKGVKKIDYLKIDTEGKDLDVLKGSELLLSKMAIAAIQVEASMNSKNSLHVPFEDFKSFFESKGYYLFKFYDQVSEDNSLIMRRSNPVFISEAWSKTIMNHRR